VPIRVFINGGFLQHQHRIPSLVVQAQQGDECAFTALVCAMQDIAVAYAASILRDYHWAEDTAQEAFVEAYRELPNLREPAAFNAWFRTILFKHCDRMTRRKRLPLTEFEAAQNVAAATPSPHEELEQQENQAALWQAIAALSEAERTVVLLYYLGEHSTAQIAAFLDITLNAVKTRLYAARKRLKKQMGQIEENLQSARPSSDVQFAANVQNRLAHYKKLAEDLLEAYRSGDAEALQRLAEHLGGNISWERLRKNMQLALGKDELSLADAQLFLARAQRFENWQVLADYVTALPAEAAVIPRPVKLFRLDAKWNEQSVTRARDWDTVIGLLREQRIPGLNAEGQMTDDALERISRLDHVTALNLSGSSQLTDDGLLHLARMPQLQYLDLSGWESQITDRGLAALRHLPELRRLQMCWPQRISDAGIAHLAGCEQLESVDLLGTQTGDGAIRALTGKRALRRLKTGRQVTDAGLPLLHQFPVFKTWQGGEMKYALMSPDAEPNHLLLDGPFTDRGMASLTGLDGLFGLSFFWHVSALTADGLNPLTQLPNLGFLGCEGTLCNDEAMRHIAAIPRLRMLMGQGTVASDAGFAALSRSQTIEYIWGRECPNLTGRGFAALAALPALKGLAVSCRNVDDAGLSALPRFPALRELMPMDAPDDGYRHIGRCEQLESLVLMYCRETGDTATEHLAGLDKLKSYFASYTKITDRSLHILSRMPSLERIAFYGCAGVTNEGVVALAGLPRLREVEISGPQISPACAAAFPASVRVEISI
jgi:RNA polymerase sigma factor (sigma-70 family)